jgi:tRNA nucleotidyltransferase (CCA-adding enzyme)
MVSMHQEKDDILARVFPDSTLRQRVMQTIEAIHHAGGRAYLVGGAVRDLILVIPTKDYDIEVHGLSLEALSTILSAIAPVNFIGKSFGVLKWHYSNIDWSLPRRDFSGRKPEVIIDPNMALKEALARRDLTINAMALDPMTGTLIDPFGGQDDLKNKLARSPDPKFFTEDPLRFYRVMQFIGRFELEADATLNEVCSTMDLRFVSQERIHGEFDKLFLKSKQPSRGIRWIHHIGRLHEILPELAMTVGVLQEYVWHPEGDVFEHSMQALDAASDGIYHSDEERLLIVSSALCHDVGKALETRIVDGRIRSTGHDDKGIGMAFTLINRLTAVKKRIAAVCKLVYHHMAPGSFMRNNAKDAAFKRLAVKLAPNLSCRLLSLVATADMRGRNAARGTPLPGPVSVVEEFKARAQKLGIFDGPEVPVLTGKDLEGLVEQGPAMGKALARAYEIQIGERIRSKEKLIQRLLHKGS